jgi:hypothetical protein
MVLANRSHRVKLVYITAVLKCAKLAMKIGVSLLALFANVDNMKWLGFGATNLSHATKLTGSKLANKPTDTQLFYIMC